MGVVQVRTRLKHLFGALESWKRGEEDAKGAQEAAAPSSSNAMAVDEAASGLGAGAASTCSAPDADNNGKAGSKRPGAAAGAASSAAPGKAGSASTNNGKRPLKKVASGSAE